MQKAVAAARVVVVSECRDVSLGVPYDLYQAVLRAAEGPGVTVASTDFAECVRLAFRALDEEAEGLRARLVEATRGKRNGTPTAVARRSRRPRRRPSRPRSWSPASFR